VAPSQAKRSPSTDLGEVAVLAVIDHFVMGGAETLLTRFAAAVAGSPIKLSIACLEELDGNPAAAPLYELGTPPVNLNVPGRPGIASLRTVRRHITAVNPQIVHTHLGSSDMLAGLAARTLGIPAVSTIHAAAWGSSDNVRRRFVKACASRVIAVSEHARQVYLGHGWAREDQIVTVHNGIDVDVVAGAGAEVRRELGLEPDDLVVGMVSALRPEKGHDVAIEVIRRLRSRFPKLRLLVVGRGDLGEQIRSESADLGDAVVMAGIRHDVMRVFDAVDVCLQPSRADAFPTTVIEAMAASVPVLATSVGGIPEIVTDGRTGILVPSPPSAAAFTPQLERLLGDPALRSELAAAGRAEYEQRFTTGPWVAGTKAVYDSVLAQPGRVRGRRSGGARRRAALGRSRS
jgi:glycosyltransferase involved in cell wall biosynthesis